jgi:hypothetical protein
MKKNVYLCYVDYGLCGMIEIHKIISMRPPCEMKKESEQLDIENWFLCKH